MPILSVTIIELMYDGRVIAKPRETPILKPWFARIRVFFMPILSVTIIELMYDWRVIAKPRETPILKPWFARIRVFLCLYFL